MVLTILNEAIILSAICEEKTSKSESYPWILKLSLEQNPTTGTGPRSDCQCASGIPPREHSTLDQTSSISSWYQATAAKEDSIKLIPACGLIDRWHYFHEISSTQDSVQQEWHYVHCENLSQPLIRGGHGTNWWESFASSPEEFYSTRQGEFGFTL